MCVHTTRSRRTRAAFLAGAGGAMSAVISSVSGWLRNVKAFFVACHWDDLFGAIDDPAKMRWYLRERTASLQLQLCLLSRTLQVERHLLSEVDEVAEIYDRATFTVGQFVAHFPAQISRLSCAATCVAGLAHALRNGWAIHDGIGKFAASALLALASAPRADERARLLAIDALLEGLHGWLRDARRRVDAQDVCGCSCDRPATAATCWLERLFARRDGVLERRAAEYAPRDVARARARATSGTKLRPPFSRSGTPTSTGSWACCSSRSASSAATRS